MAATNFDMNDIKSRMQGAIQSLKQELSGLRTILAQTLFLVPGFGAQGATGPDCAGAFREDGLGSLINSSREIIFAFPPTDATWETRVHAATHAMIQTLREATPMKNLSPRPTGDQKE